MAEDGGRWLTWLLGTDPMHNRMLQNLRQEASSGVSAARRAWEAVQSDTSTRSEQRGSLEDGGRWRKMAHLVALDCNAKGTRLMVSKQS
jgi:hypothetical protein